jgi:hypothetical protein
MELIFIAFILELKSACLVVIGTKDKTNNNFITTRYLMINFSHKMKRKMPEVKGTET